MVIGYPFSEKKLWARNDLVCLVFPNAVTNKMRGVSGAQTSFRARTSAPFLNLGNPSLNQVQSLGGYLQWISQIRPWVIPFLSALRDYSSNPPAFKKNWSEFFEFARIIRVGFLSYPAFLHRAFVIPMLKGEIYTESCDRPHIGNGVINLEPGV